MKPFSQAMSRHYYIFSHSLHIPKCYQELIFSRSYFWQKNNWIGFSDGSSYPPWTESMLNCHSCHRYWCYNRCIVYFVCVLRWRREETFATLNYITTKIKSWTSQINLQTKCFFRLLYSIPHKMLKLLTGNKFKKLDLSSSWSWAKATQAEYDG